MKGPDLREVPVPWWYRWVVKVETHHLRLGWKLFVTEPPSCRAHAPSPLPQICPCPNLDKLPQSDPYIFFVWENSFFCFYPVDFPIRTPPLFSVLSLVPLPSTFLLAPNLSPTYCRYFFHMHFKSFEDQRFLSYCCQSRGQYHTQSKCL